MLQICSSKLFNSKSAKISKIFYSKLHSMCLIHLVITWAKFLTVHSNISICVIVSQAGQHLLRLEMRALHKIEILQTSQLQKRVQNKGLVKNTLHICPWSTKARLIILSCAALPELTFTLKGKHSSDKQNLNSGSSLSVYNVHRITFECFPEAMQLCPTLPENLTWFQEDRS